MMKKNISITAFAAIIYSCISILNVSAQCEAQFIENEGLLVAEIEEGMIASGWIFRNDIAGHLGSGFFEWQGSDNFGSPGAGIMEYKIKINNPGTYQFKWHSKVGRGTNPTEHNDSWLKIPDAADFYGYKSATNSIVRPKGTCTNDCPNGAGSDGWFKVFLSGTTNWTWSTKTSDNNGHDIFAKFDTSGIYTVLISGRSKNHMIDRFVMYNTETASNEEATNLNVESSMCADFEYDLNTIGLTVKSATQKLANVEVQLGNISKSTNQEGKVVFESLQRTYFDTLRIISEMYEPYVEPINILGSYNMIITLVSKRYDAVFQVTDGTKPVEGANVKISTLSSLTNAEGIAIIENLLPFDGFQYTVSFDGFIQHTGTFNIVNSDVQVNVELIPTAVSQLNITETRIYPNPVSNVLYVEDHDLKTLDIYSKTGQFVATYSIIDNSINLSELQPGIYFGGYLNDNNEKIMIKIIKN
jgi:hypothetical protein